MSLKQTPLRVVLGDGATTPTRGTEQSAGYDLYLSEELVIAPGETKIGKTNITVGIPDGYVGLIWPRSSVDFKQNVTTGAGVIDADYRGLVGVVLHNRGVEKQTFVKGTRVAQMVIVPCLMTQFTVVDNLSETEREGGFGSTGV